MNASVNQSNCIASEILQSLRGSWQSPPKVDGLQTLLLPNSKQGRTAASWTRRGCESSRLVNSKICSSWSNWLIRLAVCSRIIFVSWPVRLSQAILACKTSLVANSWSGPLLLGCSGSEDHNGSRWKRLAVHRDEEQVHKDVDRAFVHYPSGEARHDIRSRALLLMPLPDEPEKTTETRKGVLYDLIVRILRSHPMLCYFQGFHDIAQVLLLVLGANAAYPAIESVCLLRIRDYMLPTIGPAVKPLELLPVILQAADQELARHLTLPHANYALPATLTLYAHIIEQYSDIARLFDFILAHEPVMSVYLFAGTILSRREQILEIPADDHDMMFFVLQKLPQPLDLEPLISNALAMFAEHPPGRLPGRVWRNISSSSVLKTAQVPERNHDLNLAMLYFQRQAAEIRWDETKKNAARMAKKYKRPAATTAAAVAIGALSIWMRRSGNDRYIVSLVLSLIGVGHR